MPSDPPPQLAELRVRVFIDFWNFQIALKNWSRDFSVDWRKLGPCLARHAVALVDQSITARHEGLHVYASYDRRGDGKLREWMTNTLDRFPGVQVVMRERKTKSPPKCPVCHKQVETCPHCSGSMKGTVEKGIDTAIVTDMIRLAWAESYDVAVLVTSDRDFIPAVEFLDSKGRKIVNAYFPGRGFDLAKKCWGSIDITKVLTECERPQPAGGMSSRPAPR